MVISEQLFDYDNKLKVRCSSNLYHLYHRSSEKSISLERRRHKQHGHHTSTILPYILDQEEEPPSMTDPPERNTLIFGIFDTSSSTSDIYRKNCFLSIYLLLIACYFLHHTR
nr:unnamed protein product [Callosobruchus analis]